jgi:hypothetical protein
MPAVVSQLVQIVAGGGHLAEQGRQQLALIEEHRVQGEQRENDGGGDRTLSRS